VRKIKPADRASIIELLAGIDAFDSADKSLALELVDTWLADPSKDEYRFIVAADENDQIIGYICYGQTPLTEGTYDVYWIGVSPAYAGYGIGTRLLEKVESILDDENGRLILIETSSSQMYAPARHFYLKNGYRVADTIPDFYRRGEDRIIFIKNLQVPWQCHIRYKKLFEWLCGQAPA
jgi:ribosomal protein S18 acetylase RimI-like enzyme